MQYLIKLKKYEAHPFTQYTITNTKFGQAS